ncbi:MAG: DUF502 domain-containing protein, partial [Chitinispirillaceae bacterium]|nr:DUF502 domain-containing protein [Chitinispirillaceae bacterium]
FQRVIRQVRSNIVTGIFLIIPVAGSIFIIMKLFTWADRLLPAIVGMKLPAGLGIALSLIIAFLAGFIGKYWMGKRIIELGNALLTNIPVLSNVYLVLKEIMDVLRGDKKKMFDRAVLVEFPRKGSYTVGFLTSETNVDLSEKTGKKLVGVFVPTVPNPTTGFLMFFPEDDVIPLDMPAENAFKMLVSAGLIGPDTKLPDGKTGKRQWTDLFGKKTAAAAGPAPDNPSA